MEYETIEVVIKEAQLLMFEKDYGRALILLEDTVAEIEGPDRELENDSGSDYFCFENQLEEILYRELYQPTKDIHIVAQDYAGIYFLYGIVLVELDRLEEAEGALIKSSRWNPIMVEPRFELGEIYKKRQQYQEYFEITSQCLERAYRSEDIARCYRNLGYYYIYQGNFELAIAVYCFSIPFYVGLILCIASTVNFVRALLIGGKKNGTFVEVGQLKLVLSVLVPSSVYVALVGWLGIYVPSILYIAFFMIWLGKYAWWKAVLVSVGTSVFFYAVFEVWFQVPLPKGPVESMLGIG